MSNCVLRMLLLALVALAPASAWAQASVTGTVRDASNAVLPGVTVEASSPALIEKVRTAVTDGRGQFRITDLPSGTYRVSFALPGFATVQREGIELSGSFTATIDAALKIGGVEETITITGDAPIVDVQSTVRQDVLKGDLIAELPVARNIQNVVTLIPGLNTTGNLDVGGLRSGADVNNFSAHGGRVDDGRLLVDGMNVGGPTGGAGANSGGGGTSYFQPDVGNAQEVAVTTSGALGEAESGGPQINVIPRSGGNDLSGSFFFSYANDALQGSNLSDDLRALNTPTQIRVGQEELLTMRDTTVSLGGPLMRDRLWYFASGRTKLTEKQVPLMFYNLNAGANSWFYRADRTRRAFNDSRTHTGNVRFTYQLSQRQKLSFFYDRQTLKDNHDGGGSATVSPEAAGTADAYPQNLVQLSWQSPWTSRLLLDASFSASVYDYGGREREGNETRALIRVVDTGSQDGISTPTYRSMNWNENHAFVPRWRASAAYVTGAHSFKFGTQGFLQVQDNRNFTNDQALSYTFQNGSPRSLTMTGANPLRFRSRAYSHSFYAQEQWTLSRLTLQGAARYDYARSEYPEQTFGGTAWHPLIINFPKDTTGGITGFHDLNPRGGVIYDLTGDGKTSIKFNFGRYTDSASSDGRWTLGNPMSRIQTTVGRTWTDGDGDFVPDCDLLNPAQNGFQGDVCGPWNNNTFGTQVFSTTYDPDMFRGWFTRPMDWQLGASVQREILPRTSIEVGYHKRWADKWTLIENTLQTHADFEVYSVTGPVDDRLGDASGRTVGDLWNVIPSKFGQINENTYLENNIEGTNRQNWWQGVDINVNTRMRNGLSVRGGVVISSAGDDYCSYIENGYYGTAIAPGPGRRNCRSVSPWRPEFKGLASYIVPKVDVQVAATLNSRPGPQKTATVQFRADEIDDTLGRFPSGQTTGSQTTPINLFNQFEDYYPQISVVDLRIGKIVRLGGARANIGFDIYNALNANTGQAYNGTYTRLGTGANTTATNFWGTPTLILPARFAKFSVQLDF